MITEVVPTWLDRTGVYYDETGKPMLGSTEVRDATLADHVVAETRTLLAHTLTAVSSAAAGRPQRSR